MKVQEFLNQQFFEIYTPTDVSNCLENALSALVSSPNFAERPPLDQNATDIILTTIRYTENVGNTGDADVIEENNNSNIPNAKKERLKATISDAIENVQY